MDAKPACELQNIFESTTAGDNCLVFNLPPDKNGDLVANQRLALMELAKELKLGPGMPFPKPAMNLAVARP